MILSKGHTFTKGAYPDLNIIGVIISVEESIYENRRTDRQKHDQAASTFPKLGA